MRPPPLDSAKRATSSQWRPHRFAELGTGQKALDQPSVRSGIIVARESLDLAGCRRQTDQVEVEPPHEHAAVRRWIGPEPGGLECPKDKPIDGRLRPCVVLYDWRLGITNRPEGPKTLVGA